MRPTLVLAELGLAGHLCVRVRERPRARGPCRGPALLSLSRCLGLAVDARARPKRATERPCTDLGVWCVSYIVE